MQKIIITGASGFIGKSLANALTNHKDLELILLSKTNTTKPFKFIKTFDEAPDGEILIHLAETSDRNIVNSLGNKYIYDVGDSLDILLKKKFKKVIYLSSSSVYGEKGLKPYKENDKVFGSDIYSIAKLNNEDKVLESGGVVVRAANVIGPNMSQNNVFSEIIAQLNISNKITVKNDKPIRDFIWHQDLVSAIIRLIGIDGPNIFNVGTGTGISIREIAETVSLLTNTKYKIYSLDNSNLSSYNVVNVEKIKKFVNWTSEYTITKIIGEMIKK